LWTSQPRRLRLNLKNIVELSIFPRLRRRALPSPALCIQSLPPPNPTPASFCQQHPSPLPNCRRRCHSATMSAYTSPGNSYPHASIHGPGGGASNDPPLPTHHALPAPLQSYPYDPQTAPQLQSPYSNGHANGHGGDAQQAVPPPAPASATGGENQKGIRLRKACDSCSIRKVKVATNALSILILRMRTKADAFVNSATSQESHVELALDWISHALSTDPAGDEALPIDMQKQSRSGDSNPHLAAASPLRPPLTMSPRRWQPSPSKSSSMPNQSAPSVPSNSLSTISSHTSTLSVHSPMNLPSEMPSEIGRIWLVQASSLCLHLWLVSW
jgi:hypothetical protein